jgi:hypothetical protein
MNQLREVHTCAFVKHPYERLSAVIRHDPSGLIHRVELDPEFVVELRAVEQEADGMLGPRTRLCLAFSASHHPELLPALDATLDLLTLGPAEAQLDFVGKYRPPHGIVGAVVDRVIGHRIVDAAVHRFVEHVAESLRVDAAA